MNQMIKQAKYAAGFTLIELLIAAAIGAFLLAGVFTVFTNGRDTQASVETQTQMIDDGRFALRSLAYDIRHAGLWGKTNNFNLAGSQNFNAATADVGLMGTVTVPDMPGDCEAGWYRNTRDSFFVADNLNPYTASGCIPNGDYRLNTDVMVTKYAPPSPVDAAEVATGVLYAYVNHFKGQLFIGSPAPTWTLGGAGQTPEIFRIRARAYYVNEFTDVAGDGRPALYRVALGAGPSLSRTMMVPGVEDMQVQLGVDTNNDGSVNMYVDANNAAVGPNMQNVKSVQFWVMIRSEGDDELLETENQYLSMAGRAPEEYKDGFRRVVISTVVRLQNRLGLATRAGS